MRLRDDGQPERVRHPLAIRLPVGGEPEHRLDQRLELERRADLGAEARGALARVPELVRRARLDHEGLADAGDVPLASDLEAERALDDLEGLRLVRVDVRRGDEAVGLDRDLDEHVLPVGVGGRLHEVQGLAGHGILEGVSGADHRGLLVSS